jgi:hypothetical protein
MERRIARRFEANCVLEIWIPKKGVLGRARTAEFPANDISIFGAGVEAHKSDGLKRGQVVQVSVNSHTTSAIVRNEFPGLQKNTSRYGLEFVKPSDEFLTVITALIDRLKQLQGESASEQIWLRSA